MGVKRPNVDVHIERVVLTGFEHLSPVAIEAAVSSELAHCFGKEEPSMPTLQSHRTHSVDAGSFEVDSGSAEAIGRQIARGLYSGIRRQPGAQAKTPIVRGRAQQ